MAFNINDIKANMNFDGARPSLFEVTVQNPVSSVADAKLRYMVKVAQLPTSVMGVVEVPYFGRKMKIAGNRTYEPWTTTVINDEDFSVRRSLEAWSSRINSAAGNLKTIGQNYRSTADVVQFAQNGVAIRRYKFVNCWPKMIGPIELSWESVDALEEYTVEWEYDYWTVDDALVNE